MKVSTPDAPAAIGPYSQAIVAGDFVFVSGQLPVDPKSGKMAEGDVEALTSQVIDNLEAILKSAGLTLENVVKTEVFLKDLSDFQAMNRAYAKRFLHAPARAIVQVAKLPLDAKIEISCTAYRLLK